MEYAVKNQPGASGTDRPLHARQGSRGRRDLRQGNVLIPRHHGACRTGRRFTSGDSNAVYPPQTLSADIKQQVVDITVKIARALKVVGLVNIQFVIYSGSGLRD